MSLQLNIFHLSKTISVKYSRLVSSYYSFPACTLILGVLSLHARMLSHFSCVWLCDSTDCSPPGSSVHGTLQARILEWVAMPSSRDLPDPGVEPVALMSSALTGGFFSTTWEAHLSLYIPLYYLINPCYTLPEDFLK